MILSKSYQIQLMNMYKLIIENNQIKLLKNIDILKILKRIIQGIGEKIIKK